MGGAGTGRSALGPAPRGKTLNLGPDRTHEDVHRHPQHADLRRDGFLFFILAELSYITYHAGLTHFLFAHTIAEVLDIVALVTIAMALRARSPGT